MSKRRINKQQSARIERMQQNYQINNTNFSDGLVITRFKNQVAIEDTEGNHVRCSIRSNLNNPVAGDKVIWQKEDGNQGVVISIYPRKSVLAKPNSEGESKPVAANITQLIIVIAPKPKISWSLLDSYLVLAEVLQLRAIIVLNKIDLPCEVIKKEIFADYEQLKYPIILGSKNLPDSLEVLKQKLKHQISVFVGQSGVGKSSIISKLLPNENNIYTKELSEHSELGQHTTSNSYYYHIPSGGALIDSPGVREFSLWNLNESEIAHGYIEFRPFINQCKFRNCTHQNTSNCAITKAILEGLISEKRYSNFLKLCAQYTR